MVTPSSFLRKSGPVKTGPTGPAPTPMNLNLCYHPYLVSMLFSNLLSLHLVTFLMSFVLYIYVPILFTVV